ncbi:MAG: IS21 family transposase [Eubacteriales bacterium]|nr:IS21 family transposase [Eubacteriales bacterium]MDD4121373.1 IS21 family transposase [Eubacteriales bacterium]HHT27060.1 IS21 family transposase [Bacillota bacterium]
MTDYRQILRLRSLGLNHSQIANSLGVSRTTVIRTLQRAQAIGLDWVTATGLGDKEVTAQLFPSGEGKPMYRQPDFAAIHKELAKPGVTQQLVWMEYCDACRAASEIPYQLSRFKELYHDYALQNKATMHISRKPGEIMEVDWAGQTAHVVDTDTGELLEAYVFVAALPYSGYAYAEAFWHQDQAAWTAAHVNAYNYFGGVARILVPDNLKTGVIKHTKREVVLNKAYQELAEHYGTAIIPTRVRTPKDKATVEGTVGKLSTFILAAVRNQRFFSLRELNETIRERLKAFNRKPFQNKDGSRATWFAEERASLLPLPQTPYELADWRIATVAFNYHVAVDERYYSVPYEYIKRQVQVRLTSHVVEVFYDGDRICSHIRLHGRRGEYSTQEAHMPQNHQQYVQWNGERFRKWAAKTGTQTAAVVEAMLTSYKVEQQAYRACMALLKLGDAYSPERLEAACAKALTYSPRPGYKAVQTILKAGQDSPPEALADPDSDGDYGFTRGADYYGEVR